ncbi:MAG: discoidin domain-containing protein [Bermanella sp.]
MKLISISIMLGLLTACGGGGSGHSTSSNTITGNLALPTNGAEVSATYDENSAAFTTDGDNTTSLYWAGNIADDAVTVNLSSIAEVTELSIYTNDSSFNTSNPSKYIEISIDGETWNTTGVASVDVNCSEFSVGDGKVLCKFNEAQEIQYVRVRVMNGDINIYEIEAMGSRTRVI